MNGSITLFPWAFQDQNAPYREAAKKTAAAEVDLQSAEELAQRNETTAMRQNSVAMGQRGGGRLGGARYSRRQAWRPGGTGGLAAANSSALKQARLNAANARIDQQYRPYSPVSPNLFVYNS